MYVIYVYTVPLILQSKCGVPEAMAEKHLEVNIQRDSLRDNIVTQELRLPGGVLYVQNVLELWNTRRQSRSEALEKCSSFLYRMS